MGKGLVGCTAILCHALPAADACTNCSDKTVFTCGTQVLLPVEHNTDLITQISTIFFQSQVELNERLREHEAVKMIRLKNGLVKWSLAHKELAEKSHIIFSASHDIAQLIPDVPNSTDIQVCYQLKCQIKRRL